MIRPADLPDGRLEDELRAAFTGATDDLPLTRDPWARTMRAVARSRARRRAGALAAVAVAALTVAGTVLPIHGTPPDPSTPDPGPTVTSSDVTTWPTRGNLADRADLVAQVRQAAFESDQRTVWSVPFLGDVDGLRVAFVVKNGDPELGGGPHELVVLAGSPATSPAAWGRSALPLDADGAPVLQAAVRRDDGVLHLVVVTLSAGPRVQYSSRPLIDARGAVRREFVDVPLEAGVGTASWAGTAPAFTVQVRAGSNRPETAALPVLDVGEDAENGPGVRPARQTVPSSCSGRAFDSLRLNLPNYAAHLARTAGHEPGDVSEVTVAWCRSIGRSRVMVVGVTLTDGTALQTVEQEWAEADGTSTGSDSSGYPVPRGRAGTYPTYATLSSVYIAPETAGATVLLSAPGGATAELVRRSAAGTTVVARARLDADGVAVTTATAGLGSRHDPDDTLSVVVRDRAGRETERADAPTEDPWLSLPR